MASDPSVKKGELPRRVAVAAVAIPAVLALLYVGGWVLAAPLCLLAALGAREVYRLAETGPVRPFHWTGMAAAAALVAGAALRPSFQPSASLLLGVLLGMASWTALAALFLRGPDGRPLASASVTVAGAVYAAVALIFVLYLHALPARMQWGALETSPWTGGVLVALPLAATWVGDAAAYFAGTAWGKAKIAPSVSPKKSWVGAWAGAAGGAAGAAGWFFVAEPILPGMSLDGPLQAALLGGALGVAALVGDLVESLLKREAGVKDSGRLFPGHGGVLDRLDALIFTVPVTYLVLVYLETAR